MRSAPTSRKQQVEHPRIPVFQRPDKPLKPEFEQHLQKAGGAAHDVGSVAEAEAKLMALHPGAKVICSAVPEIAGTRRAEKFAIHTNSPMSMWALSARSSALRRVAPSG